MKEKKRSGSHTRFSSTANWVEHRVDAVRYLSSLLWFSLHIPAVLFRSCIGPYSISSLSAVNDFSTHPSPPSFSYTHRGVVYIFSRPIHLTFFSLKISLLSTHPLLESTTSYSLRIYTEREREREEQAKLLLHSYMTFSLVSSSPPSITTRWKNV